MADDTQGWTVVEEAAPPSQDASAPGPSGTSTGLTLAAISKLSPKAAWELMRFGTSPTAAATGGKVANAATTLAAAGHGVMTGNPSQVIAAPLEGWAAGKGGYFGTKALQGAARGTSAVLEKAAPVIDALAKVGAVQGALDLAQMAEPNRKDIGVLGVGGSLPDLQVLTAAVAKGANPAQAAAQIANGDMSRFGKLMTAYMQSRQVK